MTLESHTLAGALTVSVGGLAVAGAEASGSLDGTPRSLLVVAVSVLLSLVSALFGLVVWFIKKKLDKLDTIEQAIGEFRAEIANRTSNNEHDKLLERVGQLEKSVSFIHGKMGAES